MIRVRLHLRDNRVVVGNVRREHLDDLDGPCDWIPVTNVEVLGERGPRTVNVNVAHILFWEVS